MMQTIEAVFDGKVLRPNDREHSHGIMEAARKASLMRPSSRAKGKILTERCKSRLLGL